MAEKVDPSKLLPSTKSDKSSSAMVLYRRPNLAARIKPIQLKTGSAIVKRDDKKESKEVNNKLVQVDKFFKSDLLVSQKGAETKREDKEQDDFKKAEDKLETPNSKGFQLPSLSASLPNLGFLDRVKRFIFFTALGWIFPKLLEFLPKLKIVGNVISSVTTFAGKIFNGLTDGFGKLVQFGGDLYTKTLGFIDDLGNIPGVPKSIKGDGFKKTFDYLGKVFDAYVDVAIVSSALLLELAPTIFSELRKLKGGPKPSGGKGGGGKGGGGKGGGGQETPPKGGANMPSPAVAGARYRTVFQGITERLGRVGGPTDRPGVRSNIGLFARQFEAGAFRNTPQGRAFSPYALPGTPSVAERFGELSQQFANKGNPPPSPGSLRTPWPWEEAGAGGSQASRPAATAATAASEASKGGQSVSKLSGFFSKFPQIAEGAGKILTVLGFVALAFEVNEDIKKKDYKAAAVKIAAFGLSTLVFELLFAPIAGLSIFGAAPTGGLSLAGILAGGAIAGGAAYGTNVGIRKLFGYADGGRVSANERRSSNSTPTRSLTPQTKRIPIPITPKPRQSKPGKDVGGVKKIQRLYPDSESTKITMYEVLTSGEENLLTEKDVANPYKILTSTAKITKTIPLIGSIMGAGLDLALGEKPSQQVLKSLTMGIGYFIDTFVNQSVNTSMASMSRDIMRFADGGIVEYGGLKTIYQNLKSGELLYKMLGPIFKQKINEIIKAVKTEVDKKRSVSQLLSGSINPEAGPDGMTYSVDANSPDFWLLTTAALFENGNPTDGYQGAADVAQAIYNRLEFPGWPKTIREIILEPGQFTPVGEHGGVREWSKINSKDSAIEFARRYKGYTGNQVEAVAAALLNPAKQESARTFVGPRDSFLNEGLEKSKENKGENNGQGQISNDTQKSRYEHTFGFEPGGRNYPRWKAANKQLPAGPVPTQTVTGQVTVTGGGSVNANNNALVTLGTTTKLINMGQGQCTASVLHTMDANGVNAGFTDGTNDDPGSNPRSFIIKAVRSGVWVSLPGVGRPFRLTSPTLGSVNVNVMSYTQYVAAVNANLVPSGALVFQTEHKDWNVPSGWDGGSGGFDSAIARNGGRNLWNGRMADTSIYPSVKQVIVLVPKSSIRPDRPSSTPTGQTLKSTQVDPNTIITIREGADGKLTYSLNGQPLTGPKLDELKRKYPQAFERPPQTQQPSGSQSSSVTAVQIRDANLKLKLKAQQMGGGIPITIDGENYHFTVDDNGKVSLYKRGFGYGLPIIGRPADKVDHITPYMLEKIITKGREFYENFTPQGATPPPARPPGAPGGPGYGGGEMRGGLIQPTNSRLPIPNSYASYESGSGVGGGVAIAIQPIIITKQMPVSTNSKENLIIFPVPVEVNTNMDTAYNRSRGY